MNNPIQHLETWLITGSQHLYGPQVIAQVANHAFQITTELDQHQDIPIRIHFKGVVTTPEEIYQICKEANNTTNCLGIIAWMHTFSPAKMWIRGLKSLQKPLLHLHTQFHQDIPWNEIDMDYMNLHQSAHGDREFGHITARLRLEHKVVAGHWQHHKTIQQIGTWLRAAAGWADLQGAKFVRFGDNMRQVAVTEGDKVEAEIKFGYQVNTHGIGDLVYGINQIDEELIDSLVHEYQQHYQLDHELKKGQARHEELRHAAKIELGLQAFLEEGNYKGFTDTFEDLHGMMQLPGIAVQRLMAKGYGFGGEGDWKTAALVRAMKTMAFGLAGGNSFMEDYTYHLDARNPMVLGAHMLEICPSIAEGPISCQIHPLSIGGKADPVRLVFQSGAGPALNASIIDMGNRFRLLINTVQAKTPIQQLPKLPVANVLWTPEPDMETGCAAWIYAGGAHHTCYSQNLSAECLQDFANIAGIESILIDKDTTLPQLRNELRWNEAYYQLKR